MASKKKWIHDAVKHPGSFTREARAHGKSVSAFAAEVKRNPSKFSTTTIRRATLAQTLKKIGKKRHGKAVYLRWLIPFYSPPRSLKWKRHNRSYNMADTKPDAEAGNGVADQGSIAEAITKMVTGEPSSGSPEAEKEETKPETEGGKPVEPDELASLKGKYDALARKMEKERQERVRYQRELQDERQRRETELTNLKTRQAETTEPEKFPDPIEDPKGYREVVIQAAKKEAMKEFEPVRQFLDQVKQQQEAAKLQQQVLQTVTENLPEGADVRKLLGDFGTARADLLAESPDYYRGNAMKLAADLISYYHNQEFQTLKAELEEVKKTGVKKITQELKNAPKEKRGQGVKPADQDKESSIANQIVRSLAKRSAAQ